ncbi:MAG: DnaB-like helicase N-terminal domain-containing protein [Candidatus Hodarchaeales archaeon]|jgi:replicative DNA helicase
MSKKTTTAKIRKPEINLDYGKIPPQAVDLEEAILGAMMLEKEAALTQSMLMKTEYFYKDVHQKIFTAIKNLIEKGMDSVDILTVSEELRRMQVLEEIGGAYYITKLTSKVATAQHITIHSQVVMQKYFMRELIRIGNESQIRAFEDTEDPLDLAEWVEGEISKIFEINSFHKSSFQDALKNTVEDIINKGKGDVDPFIKTGDSWIDKEISLRKGWLCIIGGAEGSGKTKYIIHLVRKILDHPENNAAVLWYTMEDDRKQIVRSFISMDVKLTTKELQSINYKFTENDLRKVDEAVGNFKDYNIEFVDRISSMTHIKSTARRFSERWINKSVVVVIDNLGLIEVDPGLRGVDRDDFIMSTLKDIADETGALIIPVHHFNKEAAKRFNLREGYRPRKDHLRGSQRILDYTQQALFVNLPRKYKDLMLEERKKIIHPVEGEQMDFERFLDDFWKLNPHGDKHTDNLTDAPNQTWKELIFHVRHKTQLNGKSLTVKYLMEKYMEYIAWIEDTNADREKRYHKQKISIYGYLKNQMYNEDFKPDQNSRSYYLYGDNPDLKKQLDRLFIVEAQKNRDGGTDDDQVIFRYYADLDHNIFEEIQNEPDETKALG